MNIYAAKEEIDLSQVGLAVVLDTETTGFGYNDKIVELALSLFAFGRQSGRIFGVVDEYCGLQDPHMPIPYGARRVHGISDEDVRGKALDCARVSTLLKQAEFIIAHNASFDRRFVGTQFPLANQKPWLCSCKDISWRQKGFQSASLEYLLKCHEIKTERRHRALDDVHATLMLLAYEEGRYFSELLDKIGQSWDKARY